MAIIYNGTELTSLKFGDTTITEAWYCDTQAGTCTKVWPRTITYDYCAFDYSANLDFTCATSCKCTASWVGCLRTGTESSFNRMCASAVSGIYANWTCWFVPTSILCVDASPTRTYCNTGTSCIEIYTVTEWAKCNLTVSNCNCYYYGADTSTMKYFNCNLTYCANVTGTSIEYPAVQCLIKPAGSLCTNSSLWICWCSDVTVECPQGSRYVVIVCNNNGSCTVLARCPITNSAGSLTYELL